jgi:hypothetical protein
MSRCKDCGKRMSSCTDYCLQHKTEVRRLGGEASSAGRADYVRRRLDELLVWNRGRGEEVLAPIRAAWLAVQS